MFAFKVFMLIAMWFSLNASAADVSRNRPRRPKAVRPRPSVPAENHNRSIVWGNADNRGSERVRRPGTSKANGANRRGIIWGSAKNRSVVWGGAQQQVVPSTGIKGIIWGGWTAN